MSEYEKNRYNDINATKSNHSLNLYKVHSKKIRITKEHLISHFDTINPVFQPEKSDNLLHERYKFKSHLWYPFVFKNNEFHVFTLNQILNKREWLKQEFDFAGYVAKQVNMALLKFDFLTQEIIYIKHNKQTFNIKDASLDIS